MTSKLTHFETQAIHAGYTVDKTTHSTQTPLYMTSSYSFESAEQAARIFAGEEQGFVYSRVNNPTNDVLEKRMALLEGVDAGIATSSGLAAILVLILSLCKNGDEILVSPKLYGGAYRQFAYNVPRMGIKPVWIDVDKPITEWQKQITSNTKFIYVETPANPTLHMVDIAEISKLAKANNIPLVVDNTFCTPYLQQPAKLGADIIIHSTTKYLTGNSTSLGGLVLGSHELINHMRMEDYRNTGPTASPFNSWLTLLGLETLALRMDRHCDNAEKVVAFLETHKNVLSINFPGLASHAQHHLVAKQMSRAGAMLSFEIAGGIEAGRAFLNKLKLCSIVANLGDSRTLAIHPASTTHSPMTPEERAASGVTDGMIRVSVGLEHVDDIIADLEQALLG